MLERHPSDVLDTVQKYGTKLGCVCLYIFLSDPSASASFVDCNCATVAATSPESGIEQCNTLSQDYNTTVAQVKSCSTVAHLPAAAPPCWPLCCRVCNASLTKTVLQWHLSPVTSIATYCQTSGCSKRCSASQRPKSSVLNLNARSRKECEVSSRGS